MILYSKHREITMTETFNCAVIQVSVGNLERRRSNHPTSLIHDREAVIL